MVDSLIRLFEQNLEPTYSSGHWNWVGLGIGVISDAISCEVVEERNGKFELEMEYPITGLRYNDFQINRIIVAKPNPDSDPQGFRIYQITKSFDRTIKINAEHLSYQLSHVPILPLSAENCKKAMDALFDSDNQGEACNFNYWTDKDATYFPKTKGSVKTKDYDGRALEFRWELKSQSGNKSYIDWKLVGVGKLANYTNGWAYCGPVNLSIGNTVIENNAFNHPNRKKLYEYDGGATLTEAHGVIDHGENLELTHDQDGKFSKTINLDCFIYYDYNENGTGKVKGKDTMTLPDLSGSSSSTVTETESKPLDAEFKIEEPTSLRSALGGSSGSILDTYGGEFEWDNLTVKLYAARGIDKGVTIRYGKNLTDLEQEESIANTYTGILPYWKGEEPESKASVVVTPTHILYNGTALDDVSPAEDPAGTPVTSDSIHSENASLYPYQRTLPMDMTKYLGDEESRGIEVPEGATQVQSFWYKVPSPQEIYDLGKTWVEVNNIGSPVVDLTIEFAPLWQTEEYKNLALQDSVALCDVVHVYFEELGVQVSAKVVKTVYNVLLDRFNSVDLSSNGTLKASLATTISSMPQAIDMAVQESKNFVSVALEDATNRMNGVYGGQIVYNTNENGDPYEMFVAGDPESDGTYGNFIRINKEGIGFSTQGFNGPFNSAWTIDGTFDAQVVNVINLNANSINAGTLQSSNWESSSGTAGFSLDLPTGTIQAPSLVVSATNAAKEYTDSISIGSTNLLRETRNMPLWTSGADKTITFYKGAGSGYNWTFENSSDGDFVEAKINLTGITEAVWPWVSSSWIPRAKFESATNLTFSFEIKVDNLTNWPSNNMLVRVVMKDANHTTWGGNGWKYTSAYLQKSKVPKAGTWYRVVFKTPDLWQNSGWSGDGSTGSWDDITHVCAVIFESLNGSVHIRKFKLEEGLHDTDWSTAPEDGEKALEDYKGYISQNYATWSVTSNAITAEVGESITYTDTKIGAIQVGGRNVLKNSATADISPYGSTMTIVNDVEVDAWGATDAKRVYGTGGDSVIVGTLSGTWLDSNASVNNQPYVFSIYIKNNGSADINIGANGRGDEQAVTPGETKRVVIQATGNGSAWLQFTFIVRPAGGTFNFTYWHPQIELGNTVTDWSPAPEDARSGGTNLLLDTLKDANESHTTYSLARFSFTEALKVGQLYTISARVVTSSDKKSIAFYHSDGNIPMVNFLKLPRTSTHLYTATFKATSDMASQTAGDMAHGTCIVYASNNEGTQGSTPITGTGHVDWIKIEAGNVASDWSPAPEDINNQINNVTQKFTNYSTLEQTSTSITQAVSSKAETSYVDQETGKIRKVVEEHGATLETMSDEIIGTVKTTYIDDITGYQDQIKTWFKFDAEDSFTIHKEGSDYSTQITEEAFNIRYGNTNIGSFNSGGLTTPAINLLDAQGQAGMLTIAPLVIEAYSNGWTIKASN